MDYYYFSLNKQFPNEARKVNSVTENKSELWKASSKVQPTTFNSLTAPSMQQSREKSNRMGHQSSKRTASDFVYLGLPYINSKNTHLKMKNCTRTDFIFTDARSNQLVSKHQSCHATATVDKRAYEK